MFDKLITLAGKYINVYHNQIELNNKIYNFSFCGKVNGFGYNKDDNGVEHYRISLTDGNTYEINKDFKYEEVTRNQFYEIAGGYVEVFNEEHF